jgi:hypothetical protein
MRLFPKLKTPAATPVSGQGFQQMHTREKYACINLSTKGRLLAVTGDFRAPASFQKHPERGLGFRRPIL